MLHLCYGRAVQLKQVGSIIYYIIIYYIWLGGRSMCSVVYIYMPEHRIVIGYIYICIVGSGWVQQGIVGYCVCVNYAKAFF